MLSFSGMQSAGRKRRLFAVACCRRVADLLTDWSRRALDTAEAFADGLASDHQLRGASLCNAVGQADRRKQYANVAAAAVCELGGYDYARDAATWTANTRAKNPSKPGKRDKHRKLECAAQAELVRDIFGNPFRPVTFSPSWRTDTAVTLARTMYELRDFSAMPILADALQGAGCDSADILNHCRGSGPHVRGCWVVDLVLGKE
jgi:hypothetical protein